MIPELISSGLIVLMWLIDKITKKKENKTNRLKIEIEIKMITIK